MSLDIWFREDLRNILAAQVQAIARTNVSDEYYQGYRDAIDNLAVALGIEPPKVIERGERERETVPSLRE